MIDTSVHSPNYDAGRDGHAVQLVVLHATVGSLAATLAWFQNPAARVSSHYVIGKDGHIYQLVDEANTAWHAGAALWHGFTAINEMSIGIELENRNDGRDPYPAAQVTALTALVRDLMARYHLTADCITRHRDVAQPAGRKSDPAGFPFAQWRAGLAAGIYVVAGVPVYQQPTGQGPLWGYLAPGERVTIDARYPNGLGHLADGRGFIDLAALIPPA